MKSMTGYGSSEISTDFGKITVEARSENHRFLELKIQTPDSLNGIDAQILEIVKKHTSRGKIKIAILVDDKKYNIPSFNREAGKKFFSTLKTLKKELGIKDEIKLEHIIIFKELFNEEFKRNLSKSTINKIKQATDTALKKLDKSRSVEGKKLNNDLTKRINQCKLLINKIKNKRVNFSLHASKKLKEKIQNLLDDITIDESRLLQEVAFLTERTDITEELVRLNAHIGKFKQTLKKSGTVGKELDFLIQEMNREAGTISAKSKDAQISHYTISIRSEFEKMREQVQNIE